MFKIDTSNMNKEEKQFIEDIALFNANNDCIMFCGSEEIKKKVLPLITNKRLEDVKVTKLAKEIILIHKDMLKYQYKTYIPNEWDNK